MTVPSFPWFAAVPHTEFGTTGFLENAAYAAELPLDPPSAGKPTTLKGWWGADLIGKSAFTPPYSLFVSITVPTHGGRGPRETPGYFNKTTYLDAAAPVSTKWISSATENSVSYPYTARYDLGFRGKSVKNADIKSFGLDPAQYMILDTTSSDPVPLPEHKMKSPVVIYVQGSWDYNTRFGYYLGDKNTSPFESFVVKSSLNDGSGGRHGWCRSYPLPVPAANQIITPAWWTDRGGDGIYFTAVPYNAGYAEFKWDNFSYGSQGGLTITGLKTTRHHFRHPDGPLATFDGVEVSWDQYQFKIKYVRPCSATSLKAYIIDERRNTVSPFREFILTPVGAAVQGKYTEYRSQDLGYSQLQNGGDDPQPGGGYVFRVFDELSVDLILNPENADGIWWS